MTFGPPSAAAVQCGKEGLAAKLRAGSRTVPGMQKPQPTKPIITYSPSNRT